VAAEGCWELEFMKAENEREKNQVFYFEILKVVVSGCWDLGFSYEREKERLGVRERQWARSMKVECGCFVSIFFLEKEMCQFFFERCEKFVIGVAPKGATPWGL
jgi:hypothetical protein